MLGARHLKSGRHSLNWPSLTIPLCTLTLPLLKITNVCPREQEAKLHILKPNNAHDPITPPTDTPYIQQRILLLTSNAAGGSTRQK
jgi:hypothetical protein